MTIEEFGKSVKAKYPQYAGVSDAELGQKVIEKYPVYKSKITGSSTKPWTQEQKEAKKAEIDTAITHDDQGVAVEAPKQAGFFKKALSRVGQEIKEGATEIKEDLESATPRSGDSILDRIIKPKSAAFRAIGHAAKVGTDIVYAGAGAAAKAGWERVPEAVKEPIREIGKDIASIPAVQTVMSGVAKADEYISAHPNLDAARNIAEFVPIAKAGSTMVKLGVRGAKAGAVGTSKVAGSAAKTAKDFFVSGSDDAARAGKKLITKASDAVTPIEEGVETVLKTGGTATVKKGTVALPKKQVMLEKFDRYTAQAKKAVSDYSQATPLELAGKEAENALREVQKIVKKTGASKKALTKQLGKIETGDIVESARVGLRKEVRDLGVTFMRDGSVRRAPFREIKIANKADLKLLQQVDEKLAALGTNASFQKVDDTIDYLQDLLYQRSATPLTVPVHGQLEGMIKRQIGELNSALKRIGGKEYTKLNADYSDFLEIRNVLNKGLGIDANKGASLMKQLFSPNGTMPRKLFADIKALTGIDLVEDATLAKYVMERIGDVRQASLLEQVFKGGVGGVSSRGFLQMGVNKVLNKLQDPIGKAKRIIENRTP